MALNSAKSHRQEQCIYGQYPSLERRRGRGTGCIWKDEERRAVQDYTGTPWRVRVTNAYVSVTVAYPKRVLTVQVQWWILLQGSLSAPAATGGGMENILKPSSCMKSSTCLDSTTCIAMYRCYVVPSERQAIPIFSTCTEVLPRTSLAVLT